MNEYKRDKDNSSVQAFKVKCAFPEKDADTKLHQLTAYRRIVIIETRLKDYIIYDTKFCYISLAQSSLLLQKLNSMRGRV